MPVKAHAIHPKNGLHLSSKEAKRRVDAALDKTTKLVERDYASTVRTWNHDPDFTTSTPREGERLIATSDPIYGYVDDGTRPHEIRPKRGRVLAFRTGGAAKTSPGVIGANTGRPGTTPWRVKVVKHPGTKARNFSKLIANKSKIYLQKAINSELAKT